MNPRSLSLLALSALPLSVAVLGACSSATPVRTPSWSGDPARAELLRDDVVWLAADERAGRRAGTRGADLSADYIARRFAELGLEPAGEGGTWFQEFSVPLPARDGGASFLEWSEAVAGAEWTTDGSESRALVGPLGGAENLVPLFCSSAGEVRGRVEFVGWGIEDADRGWNDFPEERAGDVALVVRGVPPFPPARQPEGAEAGSWGGGGSLFQKVMNAKRRGYQAVLVAPSSDAFDAPLDRFDPGKPARAGIPVLLVSGDLADRMADAGERARRMAPLFNPTTEGPPLRELPEVRLSADVVRGDAPTRNVLGRVSGSGSGNTILIGAHYDHLGLGGVGSLAPDAVGEVHNGADDNASGTAVVMEIARVVSQAGSQRPSGDTIFALWSGEELGLLGSEYWLEHPTVPLKEVKASINLDMVGRAGLGVLQVLGAGTAAPFAGWLADLGPRNGLELVVSLSGDGVGGSDHQGFLRRGIPSLHLFTGVHTDYHKPSDDAAKFEAGGAAHIADLALELAICMMGSDDLAFVEPLAAESAGRMGAGWSVRFGSVPDYTQDGGGLRLAGTSENSPARDAGLLAGDVLIGFGDVKIDGIHDLVYALGRHKPGDVVLVRFERGDEVLEERVTLTSREAE